ncbi:cadmium family heavy metal-translocating P-type ATPase [Humibacillus sp. DSM 29435]|uniref:cadmium family heavy metal-translocating P-type ATPase n=1 Tax=Humibacillus sp. DSM 29435 TaxID=1869167 RepID=UPI00352A2101
MDASSIRLEVEPARGIRRLAELVSSYSLVATTLAVLAAVLLLQWTGQGQAALWLGSAYALAIAAYTAGGMVRDLLAGHWGVDVLAVTAVVSTVAVGEYLAALVVVLMLTGGEALEEYAGDRAGRELRSLLEGTPQLAHRTHPVTGEVEDVPAASIRPGDRLLVRPAEVLPVDGTLVSEQATLDESSLTGESLPVTRHHGESVISGSLNGGSAIQMVATLPAAESQYQRIVALVAEAQDRRAPLVRMADRYAVPFTAVSLIIAAAAWAWSGDAGRFAAVLVLATPCPLLIAPPVAFLAGMGRASHSGIIIRGGDVLERLAEVRAVAFDKTGTLTVGHPALVEVRAEPSHTGEEVLRLAASAEQLLESSHEAQERATHGVTARLPSGEVVIGKRSYVAEQTGPIEAVSLISGELAVYVAVDSTYVGALVLRDQIRADAASTLRDLADLGVQETMLLTGDAQATADHVAADLGIDDVRAECLPEDKVQVVERHPLRAVMMVGDGVNDAPVLASAHVGVAMGARGSTAASESADVVVMTDDLSKVALAVSIGQRTVSVSRQSIWLGIGLSVGLMLVAAFGFIPAIVGALIQELVDLASIGNSLRARTAGRGALNRPHGSAEAGTKASGR